MATTTTMAYRQRPVGTTSAAVNWSAKQAPVDIYNLPDTVADYDYTAYDYDDIEDDALNGEHLASKAERQQFENNANRTEGRPIYLV